MFHHRVTEEIIVWQIGRCRSTKIHASCADTNKCVFYEYNFSMLNAIELLHDKCTDNAKHLSGFYIAAVSAANKKK